MRNASVRTLSMPALTVLFFGVYMLVQGAVLLFAPGLLLSLFGLELDDDTWIRILGWAEIALAYYYIRAAFAETTEFFFWTVQVRIMQFIVLGTLVFLAYAPGIVLLFSGVELLAGLLTWYVIRYRA